MITPSASTLSDQLALVADRLECLQEMTDTVVAPNGVPIMDKMRFFCGDKPAQQFERGTQVGGAYKCGGCGCKDSAMQDLSRALQCPPRSLQDLQSLILAGKYGNQPGQLKPLDQLLVAKLREELIARGHDTDQMLKPEMQALLTEELKGAQRVPSLLVLNPTQSIEDLHLQDYEVLDCEPLHDYKGRAYNLLQELPLLLASPLRRTVTELIATTLQKDKVSGVLLRVATIKVYLKVLKEKEVDDRVKQLPCTLVKICELLYASESSRTPRSVLQLYNVTWLHHELCCDLLPNPRVLTRERLYGVYFHDLVVHAPSQYEIVCLRSTNAESTEAF